MHRALAGSWVVAGVNVRRSQTGSAHTSRGVYAVVDTGSRELICTDHCTGANSMRALTAWAILSAITDTSATTVSVLLRSEFPIYPARSFQSTGLTLAATARIRTVPGPACGSGTSSTVSTDGSQ